MKNHPSPIKVFPGLVRPNRDNTILVAVVLLAGAGWGCGASPQGADGGTGDGSAHGDASPNRTTDVVDTSERSDGGAIPDVANVDVSEDADVAGSDTAARDGVAGDTTMSDAGATDSSATEGANHDVTGYDAPACPASFVPPGPPPDPNTAVTLQARIEANEMATLDELIGRFLRGDVLVYRGSLSGSSRVVIDENTPPGTADVQIASGPALGMLAIRPTTPADWFPRNPAPTGDAAVLIVHSLGAHLYAIYMQSVSDPSTTWVGNFASDSPATTNHINRSCTGCAPLFATRPAALAISGLDATGVFSAFEAAGGYVDVPVWTKTAAALEVAPPCTLTWDDLATLDTITGNDSFASDVGLMSFHELGDEMVVHHTGLSGIPPRGQCAIETPYSIDVWVKRGNLTMMGTRNFQTATPTMICSPGV